MRQIAIVATAKNPCDRLAIASPPLGLDDDDDLR
jgi:hypothetical protein